MTKKHLLLPDFDLPNTLNIDLDCSNFEREQFEFDYEADTEEF